MGLNDFCASASNTKKRPRECVHIVETGLSLAKTMEALGARAAVELPFFRSSEFPRGRPRATGTHAYTHRRAARSASKWVTRIRAFTEARVRITVYTLLAH